MQGQAKLSSFFSPKRSTSSEDEVSEAKRRKPSDEAPCERTGLALTPEQKARVEEKRKNAQRLLVQKKTPPGMGETWTRALADEFAKEYFVKVPYNRLNSTFEKPRYSAAFSLRRSREKQNYYLSAWLARPFASNESRSSRF